MSRHALQYRDREWPTAEALFQSLRFTDDTICELIRTKGNPMSAKATAYENRYAMTTEPRSPADVENMRIVLLQKVADHPELLRALLKVDEEIIENCTNRPNESGLFWGAALRDGTWVGQNVLGKLWMEVRDERRGAIELVR
jgi:hypothetical protein